MTTRRFLFKRPDGGITVFNPNVRSRRNGESEEECINRVVRKKQKDINIQFGLCELLTECDRTDLPSKEFRDAWMANPDGTIRVDEERKQEIIAFRSLPVMEQFAKNFENEAKGRR